MQRLWHKKALLSTLVMWLLGGVIMRISLDYEVGSLRHMGPGFLPYYCGLMLVWLGVIYLLASWFIPTEEDFRKMHLTWARVRGWCFIFLGMVLFVVLGERLGFAAATFSLVLVSSFGSTEFRWLSALLLAAGVTLLGAFIFVYLLELQIPLFELGF